jgi:glutamine synthetase
MTTLADPVPGGRPGDPERADGLAAELATADVHGVVLAWVDTAGITRVKTVPVAALDHAAAWGVGMSPVFDTFLADDSIVSTDVLGGPDGDLRLYPDLDQLVALAGQPGWAWAPVDRITQDGAVHPACTRTLLRHVVQGAAAEGLTFRAGVEIEFALGLAGAPFPEFAPACHGPAYGMVRQVEQSEFGADLLQALAAQAVEVDQLHPEYATGQYEVSVGATDPVAAADRSVLVRQTVLAVARRHGLRASFAPAVQAAGVGNGGHLHLSAWRDGRNLHSGGDGRLGMTADAEGFLAGVVSQLPALSALLTPSPSSFLRMQPSHWAGVFAAWGHENREAAARVVTGMAGNRDTAANLEVKCVDLAANPYLALAGVLTAGLDGLHRGLRPGEPVAGDPAGLDPAELADRGVHRLPESLPEAIGAFEKSALLRDALGDVLADAVLAVRRGEQARAESMTAEQIAEAYRWVY